MIPAILRSACRGNDEIDKLLIDMAIKVLQPYLVYRSVLRAISKALHGPIIDTLESKLPKNRQFFGVWSKFREAAGMFLAAKEGFDASGENTQRCSSTQVRVLCPGPSHTRILTRLLCLKCDRVEGDENFKLCSQCQEACYCSSACQRYNWRYEGHREACASLSKDRAGMVDYFMS